MDIEALKLILETVKGVSDNAGSVAVWWIAGHYISGLLNTLMIVGGVVGGGAMAIIQLVKSLDENRTWADYAKSISKAYGGTDYGFCSDSDKAALRRALKAKE